MSYESNKKYVDKYRKDHIARVAINIKKEEKEQWERVAAESGIPLATLIRKLMNDYMNNK